MAITRNGKRPQGLIKEENVVSSTPENFQPTLSPTQYHWHLSWTFLLWKIFHFSSKYLLGGQKGEGWNLLQVGVSSYLTSSLEKRLLSLPAGRFLVISHDPTFSSTVIGWAMVNLPQLSQSIYLTPLAIAIGQRVLMWHQTSQSDFCFFSKLGRKREFLSSS